MYCRSKSRRKSVCPRIWRYWRNVEILGGLPNITKLWRWWRWIWPRRLLELRLSCSVLSPFGSEFKINLWQSAFAVLPVFFSYHLSRELCCQFFLRFNIQLMIFSTRQTKKVPIYLFPPVLKLFIKSEWDSSTNYCKSF